MYRETTFLLRDSFTATASVMASSERILHLKMFVRIDQLMENKRKLKEKKRKTKRKLKENKRKTKGKLKEN